MAEIARNVRNNNPGNIRIGGSNWDGTINGSDSEFETFATPEMGVRAMTKTLYTYQDTHNLSNIRGIVSRWAPYGENDTGAYIDFISQQTGIDPDAQLDLKNDPATTKKLINAMILKEGGKEAVDHFASHVSKGIKLASGDTSVVTGEATNIAGLDSVRNPLADQAVQDATQAYTNVYDPNGAKSFENHAFSNMKEVLNHAESTDGLWENELDTYENYSYNVEFFVVPEEVSREYLQHDRVDFQSVINGNWPGSDVRYITIAKTATTTEFNIDNLQIDSRAAGSGNTRKMVGLDVSLSFDITQVGNTTLSDSLMSAITLMGYPQISQAVYYMKITYKGYDENNTSSSTNLPVTKVIPFVFKQLVDLSTTTSAGGTVTSFEGNILSVTALNHSVNTTQFNVDFDIKPTLVDTLTEFVNELNVAQSRFSSYTDKQARFKNTYEIVYSPAFETYKQSKMNGNAANLSSASNEISTRTNGVNVAKQKGTLTAGISIIDIMYDLCIQSTDIRKELLKENPGYSNVIRIIPEVIPKSQGYNVLTGDYGVDVKYNITMHEEIVVQNQSDQVNKMSFTRNLLASIFDMGRCRKVYYYDYTGLNDQILDLTISLDKQLIKSYQMPGDEFSWNRFLKPGTDIKSTLDAQQENHFNTLNGELNKIDNNKKRLNDDLVAEQEKLKSFTEEFVNAAKVESMKGHPTERGPESTYGELGDSLSGMQARDPELFAEVMNAARTENYNALSTAIKKAQNAVTKTSQEADKKKEEIDRLIQEQIGVSITEEYRDILTPEREAILQELSTGNSNNLILLEELGSDFLRTKLDNKQFESLMAVLMMNPVVFKRVILPQLIKGTEASAYKSSDPENVELARSKFYESLDADISMQRLSMTIKGDPFWSEYYLPKNIETPTFANNNSSENFKGYNSKVNGSNYMMLVVNKAADVDEFDNVKIEELEIFVYQVNSVMSIFSGGQFTQQLDCVRMPIPKSFASSGMTSVSAVESNGTDEDGNGGNLFDFGSGGEFAGVTDRIVAGVTNRIGGGRGGDPGLWGDPFGAGLNNLVGSIPGDFTSQGQIAADIVSEVGRGSAVDPRIIAENSFSRMSGALSSLATVISESSLPSADQASRLTSLLNEAQMASNYGSVSATTKIAEVKKLMTDTFGTPEEASQILQQLTDNGETVSPELIAMLNTQVYEGETVTAPTGIDTSKVNEVMTEIQNLSAINTSSVDEIALNIPSVMAPVVNTDSTNTTAPSKLELSNSNMMLDGTLPLESTESYTSPKSPLVQSEIEQLEKLDLPDDVVSGYTDILKSGNGIKVRNYIDSLPQDQAELLNSIDSSYVVKSEPYVAPTVEQIVATPLKTPREAIIQARIADAQTQMIAEAGGSYNDLSSDEKRHYENLSDAYDEIDTAAQLDPIRSESKLITINDELDKSIRIYNDKLSGGDSEWSWNEEEALSQTDAEFKARNDVASLSYSPNEFTAERIRVNPDGSIAIDLDSESMATKPSNGYVLPLNAVTDIPVEDFTEEHLAQYESANAVIENLFTTNNISIVKAVTPDGDSVNVVTGFTNTDLASVYNIPFSPNVLEGDVVDPSSTSILTRNYMLSTKQNVADSFPLIGNHSPANIPITVETWKEFIITDPTLPPAEFFNRVYKTSSFYDIAGVVGPTGGGQIYAGSQYEKSFIEADIAANTASQMMIDYYNRTFPPDWDGFRWIKAE